MVVAGGWREEELAGVDFTGCGYSRCDHDCLGDGEVASSDAGKAGGWGTGLDGVLGDRVFIWLCAGGDDVADFVCGGAGLVETGNATCMDELGGGGCGGGVDLLAE